MPICAGAVQTTPTTLDMISRQILEVHAELKDHKETVARNVTLLNNRLDVVEDLLERISKLETENGHLKAQVLNLEEKVDSFEQQSNSNFVEVFGVPEIENDTTSTTDVMLDLFSKALSLNFNDSAIDSCYRMKKNHLVTKSTRKPAGILVKMNNSRDVDLIISGKLKLGKQLTTDLINLKPTIPTTPIFINVRLTSIRREIYNAAKTIKISKAYRYLWIRNGNVYMRKAKGTPLIQIRAIKDLNNIT